MQGKNKEYETTMLYTSLYVLLTFKPVGQLLLNFCINILLLEVTQSSYISICTVGNNVPSSQACQMIGRLTQVFQVQKLSLVIGFSNFGGMHASNIS
jgi:hypothetical protein